MTKNVIFTGVGGQGVILASKVLIDVAIRAGFDIMESEVHGMAQGGGASTAMCDTGKRSILRLSPLEVRTT